MPARPAPPAPGPAIGRWLEACREVLVIEETGPFLEHAIRSIAHAQAPRTRILGKATGHLRPEGELFRWQIREALLAWQPGLDIAGSLPGRGRGVRAARPRGPLRGLPIRRGPRRDRTRSPDRTGPGPVLVGRPGLPRDRRRPARREVRHRLGGRGRPRPDPGRRLRPGRRPVRRLRVLPLRDPGDLPRGRDPEPDPDGRPGQPVDPDLGEPAPPRRRPRRDGTALAEAEHGTDRRGLRRRGHPHGPT